MSATIGLPRALARSASCAKARAVCERLDRKADDRSVGVVDGVVEDVEHIEVGLVADRNEFESPTPNCSSVRMRPPNSAPLCETIDTGPGAIA